MKMCGNNEVHIPDCEETCCEVLTRRVDELEETKLEQFDIQAGTNIDVEYVEGERTLTISSPDVYSKDEVDAIISAMETGAYEEVDELPSVGDPRKIYLVPNQGGGYERYIYSNGEWKDLGSTDITLDKTTILTALGYRETTLTLVDVNNVETTKTILVTDAPPPSEYPYQIVSGVEDYHTCTSRFTPTISKLPTKDVNVEIELKGINYAYGSTHFTGDRTFQGIIYADATQAECYCQIFEESSSDRFAVWFTAYQGSPTDLHIDDDNGCETAGTCIAESITITAISDYVQP